MSRAMRRIVNLLLVAVLLYGVAVFYTGFNAIGQSLSTFAWISFFYAMLLATVNYVLRYVRFRYYLGLIGVTNVGTVEPPPAVTLSSGSVAMRVRQPSTNSPWHT